MKNTKKLIFLSAFLLLMLLPFFGNAAGIIPDALVPSGCRDGCPCSLCDLYELAGRIINFLLYSLSIPIAIVMFLWGGFKLLISGGDTGAIAQGRVILLNTVVGLALAFLGWVIINTLLDTLQFGFGRIGAGGFGAWYERPSGCDDLPKSCRLPDIHKLDRPPAAAGIPNNVDDSEIRNRLADAGIAINHGCPQTCVSDLPENAVQGLITAQNECHCIYITGGTETGPHRSHGPGIATVDLTYSPEAIRALDLPTDTGFGHGITCESNIPGHAVPCDGSGGYIDHMHVEF